MRYEYYIVNDFGSVVVHTLSSNVSHDNHRHFFFLVAFGRGFGDEAESMLRSSRLAGGTGP